MRLRKLSQNFEKYKNYENEQKMVLSSIISRLNRIGDFFDVVVKLEKFMIEEVREEYTDLIEIRQKKQEIEDVEGPSDYITKYFVPAVTRLNDKIEALIQDWNRVEKEYTTGKIYGFISAMKNFYKELDEFDNSNTKEESELHGSPTTDLVKEILDSFSNFRMYKAVMSDDLVKRLETLLSMQQDIMEFNEKAPEELKRLTLDDL